MADYNLYCLDEEGHINSRLDFTSQSDDSALAHIQQHYFGSDCEIWQSGRIVAKVPKKKGPVERFHR